MVGILSVALTGHDPRGRFGNITAWLDDGARGPVSGWRKNPLEEMLEGNETSSPSGTIWLMSGD
jgi:hypothetical protein